MALLLSAFAAHAQPTANSLLLNGYAEKVSGTDFSYHSSITGIGKSLIVRANNGKQRMTWKTETVPAQVEQPYVSFVWYAGMDVNQEKTPMHLYVNGKQAFTFQGRQKDQWRFKNADGMELIYRNDGFDRHNDQFGFLFLRVPAEKLKKGQPLELSVRGSKSNSQAWYMTFREDVSQGFSVHSYPAVLKKEGANEQMLAIHAFHFGKPATASFKADGKEIGTKELRFGHNVFKTGREPVQQERRIEVRMETPEYSRSKTITTKPVRKWEVNFVQHTHTDIGYTRPQTEIMGEHLRFIDYALDYCDATDDMPDASKFRWTCEASWAVDEYLKARPQEQIERLRKRVKEGRIEITGMYFNFDELPDEQVLAASLKPFETLRKHDIPVKVATQNDVNGIAWAMNDYFNTLGIKYLNMGTHAHKALKPFDHPTPFWWESPSGNRMLTYRAPHYMTGNVQLDIHNQDFESFEEKLLNYLQRKAEDGYPYRLIAIQHSGFLTDNSPPSTRSSEMIRKWNKRYAWPKLRSAVMSDYFEKIEARHGDALPVYQAAWPDWWTDGFGSGAREMAATRQAYVDNTAYQGALSMASMMGSDIPKSIERHLWLNNKAGLFYGEHTFGAAESISDPYGKNTMRQRSVKAAYAWEAFRRARMTGETAMGLLQSHLKKEKEPSLVVFNSLNWKRNGQVRVYIDHEILAPDKQFRIVDKNGNEAPVQAVNHRSDGTYWMVWAEDVPPVGYKKYLIEVEPNRSRERSKATQEKVAQLENQWYRLDVDYEEGALTSLYDKELDLELVDKQAQWKLGEYVLEQLDYRKQLDRYKLEHYSRRGLDTVWFEEYEQGEIWDALRFYGETSTAFSPKGFRFELRLYHTGKRIDFAYNLCKKPITDPEGIYIAFPFQLDGGKLYCDVPGGTMEAGVEQIPGSANDWNTVQNFAAARNGKAQLILGSQEAPLMQLGGINTGRFEAGAKPESNHIFGWPMNNYWVTNFNADQRGDFEWSYYFTSRKETDNSTSVRFSVGNRIPLMSRVLPAGSENSKQSQQSILSGIPAHVLLVNARPLANEDAVILHLRETAGKNAEFTLQSDVIADFSLQETDVIGKPVGNDANAIAIGARESKFYKVAW